MAYQILGFICDESLYCNIILLDRPRPSFSLNDEYHTEKNNQNEKKKRKKKNQKDDKSTKNDESDEENNDDDKEKDKDEDEEGKDNQIKNGSKTKVIKNKKKKGSDSDSESVSNSNPDSDSSSDFDSSAENQDHDDDDDYCEEDDYLAFKRETYRGVFESQLMDGLVKISYNTKKDEKKEEKKKSEVLKKSENSVEYKLTYHKSIEFEFDRFFFTIEHKNNKSIVKMIIFETKNRSYEIRFRVNPELGRDCFYYTMIAFQGCYRNQNYNWDNHLINGNLVPIKELIQEELELLALKGYN